MEFFEVLKCILREGWSKRERGDESGGRGEEEKRKENMGKREGDLQINVLQYVPEITL